MNENEFPINEIPPTTRRGRKCLPDAERVRNLNICGRQREVDYLALWNDSDPSQAFKDMIDVLRIYRPSGPFSGPERGGNTHACKLRPGTKTTLKSELAEVRKENERLRELLAKAGIEGSDK